MKIDHKVRKWPALLRKILYDGTDETRTQLVLYGVKKS